MMPWPITDERRVEKAHPDAEWEAVKIVRDRLELLGFPFLGGLDAEVQWCRDGLASGLLERTAVSEQFSMSRAPGEIARDLGISELRVYHHLARAPGMQSADGDPWRLVYVGEDE